MLGKRVAGVRRLVLALSGMVVFVCLLTIGHIPMAAAQSSKPVTLTVSDWSAWRVELLKEYAAKYRQINPNVRFEFALVPDFGTYFDKLAVSVIGGAQPAIANFHKDWVRKAMASGILQPFPAETMQEYNQQFMWLKEAFLIGGKLYFLPTGIMTAAIFYNIDLLNAAGIGAVPGRWNELVLVAKKLTHVDDAKNITQTGFSWASDPMLVWQTLIYQYGGREFSKDGIAYGSQAGFNAMSLIESLLAANVSDRPGISAPGSFQGGKVALKYSWTHLVGNMAAARDVKWDATRIPTVTGDLNCVYSNASYESGFSVPTGLPQEQTEAAFAFLKWLYAQDDYHIRLNVQQGRIPGKTALWRQPEIRNNSVMQMLATVIPHTVPTETTPTWWGRVLSSMRDRIYNQNIAPQVSLQMAVEEGNGFWQEEPATPMYDGDR